MPAGYHQEAYLTEEELEVIGTIDNPVAAMVYTMLSFIGARRKRM